MATPLSMKEIERQVSRVVFENYNLDPHLVIHSKSFANMVAVELENLFRIELSARSLYNHNAHEIAIYIRILLTRKNRILNSCQ